MTSSNPPSELTTSLSALLDGGTDAGFRELIALLYATSGRLQAMRRDLAKALGVSVAEFSVLTALMYLERHEDRIRVRTVADHLRVSGTQVTAIVGKLQTGGWVDKAGDPVDSRAVSLTLTEQTRDRLAAFAPHLRAVNDRWFDGATKDEVTAVGVFLRRMVRQYEGASLKARDVEPDGS
jgi:DNA-binding MarR family transcriptional regulator